MTKGHDEPSEVERVPMPTGYRVIASGDVVPVFDPMHPPRWIVLLTDGTVRWAETSTDASVAWVDETYGWPVGDPP